jgi:hypothetical protein
MRLPEGRCGYEQEISISYIGKMAVGCEILLGMLQGAGQGIFSFWKVSDFVVRLR